jgi:hypothetical protein
MSKINSKLLSTEKTNCTTDWLCAAAALQLTGRACCRAGIHCSSCPEPLLIKDIKVQVNKQKPNTVRPAQMKHNSDKMTIVPTSSQPCSKPNVIGSPN